MGHYAFPFGVDIDKIKFVFGSKNEELFNDIKNDRYFVNYNEQGNIEEELVDIIFKYVPQNLRQPTKAKWFGLIRSKDGSGLYNEWPNYFFVLLSICSVLGKDFSPYGDHFNWGESWERINDLLKANGSKFDLDRMTKYKRVFDTPFEEVEGCTNIYERDEIPAFYSDFVMIEKLLDKKDEELVKFYMDFRSALGYCKENRLDLVTFLY